MLRVAAHGGNEIGHQIAAALGLNVHAGPGLIDPVARPHEAVECEHTPNQGECDDCEGC